MSSLVRLTVYSVALVLLASSGATAQIFEEQKLLASDGAAGDCFGRSVAVSGDTAVIGAARDGDNAGGQSCRADVVGNRCRWQTRRCDTEGRLGRGDAERATCG